MKKIIYLIAFLFLVSCKSDNFYETERIISTDKNVYNFGDDFELTLRISPQREEKTIRIYENYRNLEISFSLVNEPNVINEAWSKNSAEFLSKTKTTEIKITKEKPFIKKFKGKIAQEENDVVISIPELNLKANFNKERLTDGTFIRIHGFCDPINPEFGASLEEYFESKDIKIMIK